MSGAPSTSRASTAGRSRNVEFDCGGDVTSYPVADYASFVNHNHGLKVEGCDNFTVRGCKFHNGGPITALRLQSCANGNIIGNYVYDFIYNFGENDPPDDCIQGIHLLACERMRVSRNHVFGLSGYLNEALQNEGTN